MKTCKIIISGGGTGGHIYPAIAIADTLRTQNPKHEILFVGAEGKMETEKVPQAGYDIVALPIRGLQRRLTLKNVILPFKLLQSLWKARYILNDFRPDVVVGVGGYASAAILVVAAIQKIPIVIQEQNSYAGLTNKWLSRFASKICVAYPNMDQYFPADKLVFTGNPVRNDINQVDQLREEAICFFQLDPSKKTVLVFGGSLGARTLNDCLKNGVTRLLEAGYQVIWQTGKNDTDRITRFAKTLNCSALIVKAFIYEMSYAYAVADIVIARAGALSISELSLAKKAIILVPSPNVAEDHQTKNAKALVHKNAALFIQDDQVADRLIDMMIDLLKNDVLRKELQKNIQSLAKPCAAHDIVSQIINCVS